MTMLPWDNWFYEVAKRRAHLADLWTDYSSVKDDLALEGHSYSRRYDTYATLLANNYALLLVQSQALMSEVQVVQPGVRNFGK